MLMPDQEIKLDADEVLAHLKHILGPHVVITNEQLQNCMHDLRKLMRKDQKKLLENKENVESSCVCSCNCHSLIPESQLIGCASSSDEDSESVAFMDTNSDAKPKPKEKTTRPTSSFIRPWRTHPPPTSGPGRTGPSKNLKEDPVKLYQHYQDVWRQHRFPGETGHAGLRWSIREKMLGQDPQPRDDEKAESGCSCKCCVKEPPVNPVASHCDCPCCRQRDQSPAPDQACVKRNNSTWNVQIIISKSH